MPKKKLRSKDGYDLIRERLRILNVERWKNVLRKDNKNMRGLIILDGPDCAGKTTLAEAIAKRVTELGGEPVINHLGKPPEGECWQLHSEALLKYLKQAFQENKVVIADRHFMSEAIYGSVYRDGSEYPYSARHIDRVLHRFRALRVICAPPVGYIIKKLDEMKKIRHEDFHENMNQVAERYRDLWFGIHDGEIFDNDYIRQLSDTGIAEKLGWYHYDVTGEQGKDLKTYSSFLLQEMWEEQEMLPDDLFEIDDWAFTGFPNEHSVLFVGDRLSVGNALNLPFFANSGSSLFLAKTLQKLGADESRIVIANINDPEGVNTVKALGLMCGRVVVMGRLAERTARREGVGFDCAIRHPQHANRFNHSDESYTLEMGEALNGWAGVKI